MRDLNLLDVEKCVEVLINFGEIFKYLIVIRYFCNFM